MQLTSVRRRLQSYQAYSRISSTWLRLHPPPTHTDTHPFYVEPIPPPHRLALPQLQDEPEGHTPSSSKKKRVPKKKKKSEADVTIRTRFTSFSHMTHYFTRAGTSMTHTDSELMTHYLRIIPYDIITNITMTHADSCLLTAYVIMTHS